MEGTRRAEVSQAPSARRASYRGMDAMGDGSFLKPGGIWKTEVETGASEKLLFCVVVDRRTTFSMAGSPVEVVAGGAAGAGAGAGFL